MRSSWQKLTKLARLARHPAHWRALRHGVAAAIEHERLPIPSNLRSVIDVGASRGQFSLVAQRMFPEARVTCFEPLDTARVTAARLLPRASVLGLALGASDSVGTLHVTGDDDSSSLLPIGRGQIAAFGTRAVTSHSVDVRRLDSFADVVVPPSLLKIDVQGFELDVLKGAQESLQMIDWVYVECSFTELYTGQALAHEVIGFLSHFGLLLIGVYNPCYVGGRNVQADLLFHRPTP